MPMTHNRKRGKNNKKTTRVNKIKISRKKTLTGAICNAHANERSKCKVQGRERTLGGVLEKIIQNTKREIHMEDLVLSVVEPGMMLRTMTLLLITKLERRMVLSLV
jgi:LEA14-like dessication related protein